MANEKSGKGPKASERTPTQAQPGAGDQPRI